MKQSLLLLITLSLSFHLFAQEITTMRQVQNPAVVDGYRSIPNFRHQAHLKSDACEQEDLEKQKACAREALAQFITDHLQFPVHRDPEVKDFGSLLYELHIDTAGQLQAAHLIRNTTPSNAYLLEGERLIGLLKELEWHPALTRDGEAITAPLLLPIRFMK